MKNLTEIVQKYSQLHPDTVEPFQKWLSSIQAFADREGVDLEFLLTEEEYLRAILSGNKPTGATRSRYFVIKKYLSFILDELDVQGVKLPSFSDLSSNNASQYFESYDDAIEKITIASEYGQKFRKDVLFTRKVQSLVTLIWLGVKQENIPDLTDKNLADRDIPRLVTGTEEYILTDKQYRTLKQLPGYVSNVVDGRYLIPLNEKNGRVSNVSNIFVSFNERKPVGFPSLNYYMLRKNSLICSMHEEIGETPKEKLRNLVGDKIASSAWGVTLIHEYNRWVEKYKKR